MRKRPNLEDLRRAFAACARGRAELLEAIGISDSNRDPLSEFSERLVAVLAVARWLQAGCNEDGTCAVQTIGVFR